MISVEDVIRSKMNELEMEEPEILEKRLNFLKVVVNECGDAAELNIGLIEAKQQRIHIDGYYLEDDAKIFHILAVVYKDEDEEIDLNQRINEAKEYARSFVLFALDKKTRKLVPTSTEMEEAISALESALDDECTIAIDIYTNCNEPEYVDKDNDYFVFKKTQDDDPRARAKFNVFYLEQISDYIQANDTQELNVNLKSEFESPIFAVKIASSPNYDVYSGSINGIALAKIYDKHKLRLLEGNVRSYLKRTQKTNSGISKTLQNNPKDFCAYNNGLAVVASSSGTKIKAIKNDFYRIDVLNNMQIVNGGQTTVTIYECFKDRINLRDVVIPAKIAIIKKHENEADLVMNISRYANTQTVIAPSDLSSNDPYYIKMEKLSRSVPNYKYGIESEANKYFWFFERTNGQYNTEKRIIYNYGKTFDKRYPPKNKYNKKILAKVVMAFEQKPDIVCLGNEKNFKTFNGIVYDNMLQPDEEYYKKIIGALILWKTADSIIKKAGYPIKAAVLPYTIAKLSLEYGKRIDLVQIWRDQKISGDLQSVILQIATLVNKHFRSKIDVEPNTAMYGRKPICWTRIRDIPYQIPYSVDPLTKSCHLLPENPAFSFIKKEENLKNYRLWVSIIEWNKETNALSNVQITYLENWKSECIISGVSIKEKVWNRLKEIFLKAVRNGYDYKGAR